MDDQLNDCKIQSNEIMAMNEHLKTQINKCEIVMQKSNELLDNLFYTNEPVTKDGYVNYLCSRNASYEYIDKFFFNFRCGCNHVLIVI